MNTFAVSLVFQRRTSDGAIHTVNKLSVIPAVSSDEAFGKGYEAEIRSMSEYQLAIKRVVRVEEQKQPEQKSKPQDRALIGSITSPTDRIMTDEHFKMFNELLQYFKSQDEFDKSVAFVVTKAEYAEPLIKAGY